MSKAVLFSLLCSLFLSCSSASEQTESKQSLSSLKGKWAITDTTAMYYRTLIFDDSVAEFTSLGDTIYRFKYRLHQQATTLVLTDMFGKQGTSKVFKLDNDSLIVDKLWAKPSIQRFYKIK